MGFKVGDTVEVTENFLSRLPHLTNRVKGGGIIKRIYSDAASIEFHKGYTPPIFLSSLKLKLVKNQQLLFKFMG